MREQALNKRRLTLAAILASLMITLCSCGEPVDKLKPKMSTRAESSSMAEEVSSNDSKADESPVDESSADESKTKDESTADKKADTKQE